MSDMVKGVRVYRHIPPPDHAGATVADIAEGTGLGRRCIERALTTFERAGMARRERGHNRRKPSRWWRA